MFFGSRPCRVFLEPTKLWSEICPELRPNSGNFDPEKFQDVSLVSKIPEKNHRESSHFFLGFLWWVC